MTRNTIMSAGNATSASSGAAGLLLENFTEFSSVETPQLIWIGASSGLKLLRGEG